MKRFGLITLCFLLVMAMTACTANNTVTPTPMATVFPTPIPGATGMVSPLPGATGLVSPLPGTTDGVAETAAMTSAESAALSKKANEAAAKISEVDSCVTAIIGDTCVAAITFNSQYQGELTDRIRDMVASRIQSVAPVVERVAVTNDQEIAAQIGLVAEKISKANALGDLTGEFDSLLGRIQN